MRQFVAEIMPDSRGCIEVNGKKFHYLRSVLRVECGDMVYVRLPDGILQQMTAAKIDDNEKKIVLAVAGDVSSKSDPDGAKALPVKDKPDLDLWLFQFIAKPPKMELIVRQAVECGVSTIVPVIGEFCQSGCIESARKRTDAKDNRWQRIITEAMEQSGSPVNTKVLSCVSVQEACNLWKSHVQETGLKAFSGVLYEQSAKTTLLHNAVGEVLGKNSCIDAASIMVGAEGGISPSEIDLLSDNGFVPVHFLTNILRCETAALYGMAVLQNTITESAVWQLRK